MLVQATHLKTFNGSTEHLDSWHDLATGIIKQACVDDYYYRERLKKEKLYLEKFCPDGKATGNHLRALRDYEHELEKIKKFFYSDYFVLLSRNIDGPSLYRQLSWNFEHGIRPIADHKEPYKKKKGGSQK